MDEGGREQLEHLDFFWPLSIGRPQKLEKNLTCIDNLVVKPNFYNKKHTMADFSFKNPTQF